MEITIDTDNYFIQEVPAGKKQELITAVAMAHGYSPTVIKKDTATEIIAMSEVNDRVNEVNEDTSMEVVSVERQEVESESDPDMAILTILKATEVPNPITMVDYANSIISKNIGHVVRQSIKALKIEAVRKQKQEEMDEAEKQLNEALDAEFEDLKVL